MINNQTAPTPQAPRWAGVLRLGLGWIFLWAFLDKLFGFGFATPNGQAWVDGVSPTTGFLKFGTAGPLKDFYTTLANRPVVDWLYMVGLAAIGLTLIKGVGLKIAGWAGALMMALFWSAALPPEHNPFLDEHIIYIILLVAMARTPDTFSAFSWGSWWKRQPLVQRFSFLR